MSIKKTGTEFFVEVSSGQREFAKSGFKVVVRNLATGVSDALAIDGTEEVETIDTAKTSTVAASATIGDRVVTLSSGGELLDGMVFDDGQGNKYYIEELANDVVTLRKPLVADLAFGDTLTEVGNTGIYLIPITINAAGQYGVRISNPGLNMRIKEIQIAVEDVVLADLATTVDTQFAGVVAQLNQLQDSVDSQGDSNFEVYSS